MNRYILAGALLGTMLLTGCVTTEVSQREDTSSPEEAAQYNVQLGLEYLRQGNRRLALEKLNRALEQDPKLADAHTAIAYLYSQSEDNERAENHYRRALRLASDDPDIRNNYGTFLCSQGRLEDAERQLLEAARSSRNTSPEVAWTNAGACAERIPDADRAEEYYREALRINSRFPDALRRMARLAYRQDNLLQARAFLQRYLEVAQHSAESAWLGYRIESTLGDREAAARHATRLKEQFADSRELKLLQEHERGQQP